MPALLDSALAARTLEIDLVPQGCYWRDPTVPEECMDFAAMERAEGEAMHGARLRLGLMLWAQREAVVRWTRGPNFGPAKARSVPRFFGRQIAREFVRISARAYSDGMVQFREAVGSGPTSLSVSDTDRLVRDAWARGQSFVSGVLHPVSQALAGAYATGRRVKPQDQLEAEIRTAYVRYLEVGKRVDPSEINLATPLTIAYRTWEKRNSPISAFLRVLLGQGEDVLDGSPQLTDNATRAIVGTERGRLTNASVWESALKEETVEALQYSALRDGRTCAKCRSLDGVVRPKDDFAFWGVYTPPLHPVCGERCRLIPVKISQRKSAPVTSGDRLDEIKRTVGPQIQPGFGGYDPRYLN
jgi:SPP1 gp7 family putative phage head morphogenesis protein